MSGFKEYIKIYENLDIFYGTWKLETPDKVITLEDGYETILEETIILNKNKKDAVDTASFFYVFIV